MLNIAAGNPITGYNLTRSLRFRSSASAYLNRTPASAGNRKTWTWSAWVKRGSLSSNQVLFISKPSATSDATFTTIGFSSSNTLLVSGYSVQWRNTTQVFRDPSAWYHIVVTWDTTQATAANRVKVYVNGSQVTAFGTTFDPSLNFDGAINQADAHYFCYPDGYSYSYFDGYLTEVNFVDGQGLTPTSFGSYNSTTGVWQPARYTGTYGTNGFYLPFTDNSALTTSSNVGLGKDFSGNGNYWTTNNISITSGTTYDSMTDVPTLTSATAANFAVLNPLKNYLNTIADGNLNITGTSPSVTTIVLATIGMSSGKWYWEFTQTSFTVSNTPMIGVAKDNVSMTAYVGSDANGWAYFGNNGQKFNNGTGTAYGATYTNNDVMGVAFDATAGTLTFYKNNVSQGTAFTGLTSGPYFPAFSDGGSTAVMTANVNFGQQPFTYTPPTGFVALNTYNLPTSTILQGNTVMDATLWTGNGTSQTITNAAGFKPDFVWIKNRNNVRYHILTDSVRGTNSQLFSNDTLAQETRTDRLTAFNSNGFSVGSYSDVNLNADTFVGWQWQAGQGTTSSNTSGTITSTVSVNANAGFSVVTYTGNGVSGATVGHGLGVAPKLVIVKKRNGIQEWMVGSSSLTSWNNYLVLNTTAAQAGATTIWNDTAPTSSVFSLGSSTNTNGNTNTFVAYCWAPIAGYSAFGSYTGNGSSDGPMVYTNFRPKLVMAKRTDSASNWNILDGTRDPYNAVGSYLYPNSSNAEGANASTLDFLANGFKIRQTYTDWNASGGTYIYMAFAENPFKNALAR